MTAPPDLGAWLRQQREHRSWTRNEMARRLPATSTEAFSHLEAAPMVEVIPPIAARDTTAEVGERVRVRH
jgi:hypothetical protein